MFDMKMTNREFAKVLQDNLGGKELSYLAVHQVVEFIRKQLPEDIAEQISYEKQRDSDREFMLKYKKTTICWIKIKSTRDPSYTWKRYIYKSFDVDYTYPHKTFEETLNNAISVQKDKDDRAQREFQKWSEVLQLVINNTEFNDLGEAVGVFSAIYRNMHLFNDDGTLKE